MHWRLNEGGLEGSRSLLEGSVEERRRVTYTVILVVVLDQYDTLLLTLSYTSVGELTLVP